MSSFCTRSQQSRSSPATPAGHQGSIWMVVSKYLELVGNILVLVDHGEWRLFIGSAVLPGVRSWPLTLDNLLASLTFGLCKQLVEIHVIHVATQTIAAQKLCHLCKKFESECAKIVGNTYQTRWVTTCVGEEQ